MANFKDLSSGRVRVDMCPEATVVRRWFARIEAEQLG